MRVCIDVNSVTPLLQAGYVSGIGRSTLDLVLAFAELEQEFPFEITLYSQNTKGRSGRRLGLPFKNNHLYFPNGEKYNRFLGKLPVREVFTNYDLYHVPHNFEYIFRPKKAVVTLHDALFMKIDEPQFNHSKERTRVPPLMRQVRAITTDSVSSKSDIVETMNVDEEKITVIPLGVSKERFYPEAEEITDNFMKQYGLSRPFFGSVSCSVGRKNTISVLRAFKHYVAAGGGFDLVLAWGKPPESILKEFKNEIEAKRIHFLAHIPDEDLRSLYSGSEAVFFPSKYEGFGFPVLESMACGTPVITCRNSSLEEVGGDVALYTDPDDLNQMAQYMYDFENGAYDTEEMKRQGLLHSQKFSWKETAAQYIQFYKKCLAGDL